MAARKRSSKSRSKAKTKTKTKAKTRSKSRGSSKKKSAAKSKKTAIKRPKRSTEIEAPLDEMDAAWQSLLQTAIERHNKK